MTTKQNSAGALARMTSSLQSDVITYQERGKLVAEFVICGKYVRATGFAARIAEGKKKGERITVVGTTVTRQWVSRDNDRFDGAAAILKSRSQMNRINATRIYIGS